MHRSAAPLFETRASHLTQFIRFMRQHEQDAAIPEVIEQFARTHAEAASTPRFVLLHIGKTGGTYMAHCIQQCGASRDVLCLPHDYSLPMALSAWPNSQVAFGVRPPDEIFVSGFYSRQRQGRPRHDIPWSPAERQAFASFDTPNQLAEALSAGDDVRLRAAEAAMTSVMHVRQGLRWYLSSPDAINEAASRIACVLRIDSLADDLRQFLTTATGHDVNLPEANDVERHRNPDSIDRRLSETARTNLNRWYAADAAIYSACLALADSKCGVR